MAEKESKSRFHKDKDGFYHEKEIEADSLNPPHNDEEFNSGRVPSSEPEITNLGNGWQFSFNGGTVLCKITRLIIDAHHLSGELEILVFDKAILSGERVNLQAQRVRASLIKQLEEASRTQDWQAIIPTIFRDTLTLYREGVRPIKLSDIEPVPCLEYRLKPILLEGQPTLLFGEGGVGKSLLADLIAVSVQYNKQILNWQPKQGNVLILDWETSPTITKSRIEAIKTGLGINQTDDSITYRFCQRPLVDDIEELSKIIVEFSIDLIICDSLGLSLGGDSERADIVLSYFRALRTLGKTSLLLDHVAKASDSKTPFGSVYKLNSARSAFHIRHEQAPGESELTIGLFHKKANDIPLLKPIGIKIVFDNEEDILRTITFSQTDLSIYPHLAVGLPLADRIKDSLTDGGKTVKDIALELEENQAVVRSTLNRHSKMFITIGGGKEGKLWGLRYEA